MEKFTKSPWRYNDADGIVYCDESECDRVICDMLPTGDVVHDANAALIAAAPEMYEMLQTACRMFAGTEFAKRAEQLLAKARGEQ